MFEICASKFTTTLIKLLCALGLMILFEWKYISPINQEDSNDVGIDFVRYDE